MKQFLSKYSLAIKTVAALIVLTAIFTVLLSTPPRDFPIGTIVTIPKGIGTGGAADILAAKGIIRSAFVYKVYTFLLHGRMGIQAGSYLFDVPQSTLRVAYRTAYGIQGLEKIKVTVPEGLASPDIARLLVKLMPKFDGKAFLALARPLEGRLFPDTYFFYENTTPEEAVSAMHENFLKQTAGLPLRTDLSPRPFDKIITMASILEEEASNTADRRIISGILWKRIDAGMALQIDVPFFYILGKTSSQLTRSDLATTSPYNTYNHLGLPPTPISNPGLDSINAAINPEETPFWFYLADSKGVTHYAVDNAGHVANIRKYLK